MFEYEEVIPVLPGNHIENWKKTRKSQWKQVKFIVEDVVPSIKGKALTNIKNNYFLSDTPMAPPVTDENGNRTPMFEPDFWIETFLLSLFLHPDQSQERWDKLFSDVMEPKLSDRRPIERNPLENPGFANRYGFMTTAHHPSDEKSEFGGFGGLEQRMLPYFVQSNVYTDETFISNNTEYRKLPWESPKWAYYAILSNNGKFTQNPNVSIFTPYQWLHEMFVSTFQYDIEYEERGDITCMKYYLPVLEDNADDQFHQNHLKSARLMIEIFEDEGTPKYLRDLWQKVKNDSVK